MHAESLELERLYPGGLVSAPDSDCLRSIWRLDGLFRCNRVKKGLFYVTVLRFIGIGGPIRISSTFRLFDSRFKT